MFFPDEILPLIGLESKGEIFLTEKPSRRNENEKKLLRYSLFTSSRYVSFDYCMTSQGVSIKESINIVDIENIEIKDEDLISRPNDLASNFMFNPTLKFMVNGEERVFFIYDVAYDFNDTIRRFVDAVREKNTDVSIDVKYREKRLTVKKRDVAILSGVLLLLIVFLGFQLYLWLV